MLMMMMKVKSVPKVVDLTRLALAKDHLKRAARRFGHPKPLPPVHVDQARIQANQPNPSIWPEMNPIQIPPGSISSLPSVSFPKKKERRDSLEEVY